jgi:hypothetical protein
MHGLHGRAADVTSLTCCCLQSGGISRDLPRQLGAFLARLAHGTSSSTMGAQRFEQMEQDLVGSYVGCGELMEHLVLYESFDAGERAHTGCVCVGGGFCGPHGAVGAVQDL